MLFSFIECQSCQLLDFVSRVHGYRLILKMLENLCSIDKKNLKVELCADCLDGHSRESTATINK
ncbi:hypothetical protein BYT27DRAFT_6476510 [Phlegmacium glaucopus]|nr:hypothetical protein BYT27DRAFT_6476510 [Phlegmacium glaucopus]